MHASVCCVCCSIVLCCVLHFHHRQHSHAWPQIQAFCTLHKFCQKLSDLPANSTEAGMGASTLVVQLQALPWLIIQLSTERPNWPPCPVLCVCRRSIFGLPVVRPQNILYHYWCIMVLLLDCTYTAFVVPIGVGFSVSDVTFTWAAVCDFVAGVLYSADMIVNFQVHPGCCASWQLALSCRPQLVQFGS